MKHILCFSGGKDSLAMLITILEKNLPLDEILYVDVGDWMWENHQDHIKNIENKLNVYIYIYRKDLWDKLREMQSKTDGYYQNGKSIYEFENKFWIRQHPQLKENRMKAREKYNKRKQKR